MKISHGTGFLDAGPNSPQGNLLHYDCLFVDVDDTLILWPGRAQVLPTRPVSVADTPPINHELVAKLRAWHDSPNHSATYHGHRLVGRQLVVWSTGGAVHARRAVNLCGLDDIVDVCLPKPRLKARAVAIDNSHKWFLQDSLTIHPDELP